MPGIKCFGKFLNLSLSWQLDRPCWLPKQEEQVWYFSDAESFPSKAITLTFTQQSLMRSLNAVHSVEGFCSINKPQHLKDEEAR